jgi:AcrR family transcriptional regulator
VQLETPGAQQDHCFQRSSFFSSFSAQKILRQDFEPNFGSFSAVYNEREQRNGKNMTENGYSPSSILRQVLFKAQHIRTFASFPPLIFVKLLVRRCYLTFLSYVTILYLYQAIDINNFKEKSMPKLVDHVSYRKQLLAQCFDLFAERGYSSLTTRQIAESLNVSTGTLYHYFPTKEALFQQLVEEITQHTVIEALSQSHEHASLEERLLDFFRFLAEHEEDLQKQILITLDYYQHRDLYGSNAHAILQSRADRYEQAIQKFVGLPDSNLCSPLFYQIHGLLTMRMLRSITIPLVEQARPFIDMFAQAVQNASGETKER